MTSGNSLPEGMGYAYATDYVGLEKRKVRFMYREEPDSPDDSGWRFLSGDEDQDYVDEPENLGIYDVSTIAAIDASIIPLLLTPPPCAFIRDEVHLPFEPCDFPDLDDEDEDEEDEEGT